MDLTLAAGSNGRGRPSGRGGGSQHGAGGAASCTYPSCSKRATYGVEASRRRQCCAEHARPWMVNIDHTRCARESCDTRATFGDPATGRREFCSKHAPAGMHNVERKKCARQGCPLPPAYGDPTNRKRRCCVEHAEEGMVKLDKKLCPFKGCFTSASYGVPGEKRKFCAAHAQRGMVSIGGRRCAKEECTKRANYGVAGTNKREFCAGHASPDMVNINNQAGGRRIVSKGKGGGNASKRSAAEPRGAAKQRQQQPRPVSASTGYGGAATGRGDPLPRPQQATSEGNMSDAGGGVEAGSGGEGLRCVVHNCTAIPTYLFPGEKKIRFCAAHAVGGTIATKMEPDTEPQQQQFLYTHQVVVQPQPHRQSRHPCPIAAPQQHSRGPPPPVYTHELLSARAPLKKRPREVSGGPASAAPPDVDMYHPSGMSGAPPALPGPAGQAEPTGHVGQLPQQPGGTGGGGATSGTGGGSGARSGGGQPGARPGGEEQAPNLKTPSALFALQRSRMLVPWPTAKKPPMLQTAEGWKAWEWRPLAMDASP